MGNIFHKEEKAVEIYQSTIPNAKSLRDEWYQARASYYQHVDPVWEDSPEEERPKTWVHVRNQGKGILSFDPEFKYHALGNNPGHLHFSSPDQQPGGDREYLDVEVGLRSRVVVSNSGRDVCVADYKYHFVRAFHEVTFEVFRVSDGVLRSQRKLFLDGTLLSKATTIADPRGGLGVCFVGGTLFWATSGLTTDHHVMFYMCPANCSSPSHERSSRELEKCCQEHEIASVFEPYPFDWAARDFRLRKGSERKSYSLTVEETCQVLREIAAPLDWQTAEPFISHLSSLDPSLYRESESTTPGTNPGFHITVQQTPLWDVACLLCKVHINADTSSIRVSLEVMRMLPGGSFHVTEHTVPTGNTQRLLEAFKKQIVTVWWLIALGQSPR